MYYKLQNTERLNLPKVTQLLLLKVQIKHKNNHLGHLLDEALDFFIYLLKLQKEFQIPLDETRQWFYSNQI